MQIREIFWSEDGWPFVAAAPCEDRYKRQDKAGNEKNRYAVFMSGITLAPALPQGITCSVPMKLYTGWIL